MNLDEMLKALEAEAKESGEKVLAEARAEANEILKKAEEQGTRLAAQSLEQANQRLMLEKAKILSAAHFDLKKEVLKAKEKVIDELFTRLTTETGEALRDNEGLFKNLADEALDKFKDQKVRVQVNKNSKEMAQKVLNGAASAYQIENNLDSIGGLKVVSEDGRITIDNTIEGRLRKVRQIFEPSIIRNLFGGEK